jgi:hypothetical protein
MTDGPPDSRTPLWGRVLILISLAMFVGLVIKTLGTGG